MCEFFTTALLTAFSGAGATAAGATATAATAGAGLANLGTLLAIGGSLYQGVSANRAAKRNVALIEQQKKTEAQLTAVKDQRERLRFASAISQQSAEIAGRGVNLNSPTAVLLGQTAAQEMAFNSQSIRSGGEARQAELTGEQLITSSRGKSALLKGGFSAASSFLTRAPDMWPALGA
jgi:hypothetical protein